MAEELNFDDVTFEDVVENDTEGGGVPVENDDEEESTPTQEEDVNEEEEQPLDDPFETEDVEEDQPTTDDGEEDQPEDEEDNVEEEEEEEEVEDNYRVVDEIKSTLGVDLEEEEEEIPDTVEGVTKVVREAADQMAEKKFEKEIGQYPDVKEYAEFRQNGGDPEEYRQQVLNAPSYEEMEVEGNENLQKNLVRQHLEMQPGYDEEDIEEELDDYESAGILKKRAERAKKALAAKQEEQQEQLLEEQREKKQQREQEIQEYQEKIKETIDENNEVAGVTIPESDKDDFKSWLYEPAEPGAEKTQADQAYQELSDEQRIAMDYLIYKGFDFEDLVDSAASSKKTEELSERLGKSSNRENLKDKSPGSTERRKSSGDDVEDIPSLGSVLEE